MWPRLDGGPAHAWGQQVAALGHPCSPIPPLLGVSEPLESVDKVDPETRPRRGPGTPPCPGERTQAPRGGCRAGCLSGLSLQFQAQGSGALLAPLWGQSHGSGMALV